MKWFIVILLGFGIWGLGFAAPRAQAACGCAVGSPCKYVRPDTTDYHYDFTYPAPAGAGKFGGTIQNTIRVYCDTAIEADSVFAVKSPICGSTPEIAPACAIMIDPESGDHNPWQLTCYGAEFSYAEQSDPNAISKKVPEGKLSPVFSRSINYKGKTYSGVEQVLWCNSLAFCCARSDVACEPPATTYPDFREPTFPLDSWIVSDPNPPATICGAPSGSGESRLWIPHLRNISALATLLQSMFNPSPSSFGNNAQPATPGQDTSSSLDNPAAVTTRITLHQGENDATRIVGEEGNNSSLIVGKPAPPPLYSFDGSSSDNTPYNNSGFCSIADTRINPGDDLLGPRIETDLTYTQKYTYDYRPSSGCVADNAEVNRLTQTCCSGSILHGTEGAGKFTREFDYCGTTPGIRRDTAGQIAVFTKTPLVEYIYDVLVVGPQSVIKRLFPQGNPPKFTETPSEAKFTASGGDKLKVAGQAGATPTLYFPHLGSLYDYFLVGLQKALRPGVAGLSAQAGTSDQSLADIAARYGVPASFLDAIWFIETGRAGSGSNCNCVGDSACGPMQIGGVAYRQVTKDGESLDRCQLPDAFELAARILLHKKYCTLSSCAYDKNNPTSAGGISSTEYYVVARYNGSDDCSPNDETECRWGRGYSYCDAVRAIENKLPLPPSGDIDACNRLKQ